MRKIKTLKTIKNFVILLLIILFAGICIYPTIQFIQIFKNKPISQDLSDWAQFSTIIGGLIAIINLGVLIYITLLIQKRTGKQNHDLFKLQRRIEAYDQFMSFFPSVFSLNDRLEEMNAILKGETFDDPQIIQERLDRVILIYRDLWRSIAEFDYFLKNFHPRYAHLFKQELDNELYSELVINSNELSQNLFFYYEHYLSLGKTEKSDLKASLNGLVPFINSLNKYINFIRTELYKPSELEIIN